MQSIRIVQRFFRSAWLSLVVAFVWIVVAGGAPADDLAVVRVGYVTGSASGLMFRIADRLGYFREERLKVDLLPFDSGVNQVGPLESADIDVAGGEPSARLYAAVEHGSPVRIVAPDVSDPPGDGFQPLVVRTDLVRSGRFKTLHDLKGLKIGVGAPGTTSWALLNALLKRGGLQLSDVTPIDLPYRDHRLALASGAIDASLLPEPEASEVVREGKARRIIGNDEFYPRQESSVAMFSGDFLTKRRNVALRFMHAYVEAARSYNAAILNGKLAGPNAGTIIRLLADDSPGVDPRVAAGATPFGIDPNLQLNLDSLQRDVDFFESRKLLDRGVRAEQAVDESVALQAVAMLGPYEASRKGEGFGEGAIPLESLGGLGSWLAFAGLCVVGLAVIVKVIVEVRKP